MTPDSPPEVDALYEGVTGLLDTPDPSGRKAGDCTCGVYLFIDYDGVPIYVGQTKEKLRTRIRRHLTNQRTDAVAMRVLDPFEVAEIEMWPFWDLEPKDAGDTLDRAEYTVYQQALTSSKFNAVLNEGDITEAELIDLPPSVRGAVLAHEARESRQHPDLRLARRGPHHRRPSPRHQRATGQPRNPTNPVGTISPPRTSGPDTARRTSKPHRRHTRRTKCRLGAHCPKPHGASGTRAGNVGQHQDNPADPYR